MKLFVTPVIILMMSLTGCASHFFRVKDNTLHIYLKKPEARLVLFAYSKDGYELHPAERIDSTTWLLTVPADSGFSYFYLVDGAIFLPECRFKEKDDFGSENCIFVADM